MPNARILVVEDEPDVCAALHSFLGRRGYEVSTTASGAEALKLIGVIRPDLVLLDVTLYEMNGLDALKELRRSDVRTRVIVITGQALEEEKAGEVLSLGVVAVLHKPVSLACLEALVVEALGREGAPVPAVISRGAFFKEAEGPDLHKVANLLGVIRNSCEAFVCDEEEGFHRAGTADEIGGKSARVMRGVIENVDRISQCLGGKDSR